MPFFAPAPRPELTPVKQRSRSNKLDRSTTMTARHDYLTTDRPPLQETGGIAYTAGIILMALTLGVMYLVLDLIGSKPHSIQVSSAPTISDEPPPPGSTDSKAGHPER